MAMSRSCPSCGRPAPELEGVSCACEARATPMPPDFRQLVADEIEQHKEAAGH